MTDTALINALWPQHPVIGLIVLGLAAPALMRLLGFRFEWRRDKREQDDSVGALMKRLADIQGAELSRLMIEGESLRRQVTLVNDGRYRLQDCLDTLREQVIAARVLIHDYERRLGLAETVFPPLMGIPLGDPSKPA